MTMKRVNNSTVHSIGGGTLTVDDTGPAFKLVFEGGFKQGEVTFLAERIGQGVSLMLGDAGKLSLDATQAPGGSFVGVVSTANPVHAGTLSAVLCSVLKSVQHSMGDQKKFE